MAAAISACLPAAAAAGESGATWHLEQPSPPAPPTGVEGSSTPVGLGNIGDIEFWSPNRGLLITSGNGSTIGAGVWAYNGRRWHQLSTVCGGTDGKIVWAGPEEFWTISDGRPGQAANALGDLPPLTDDTLCHFAGGQVVASYAEPAFEADSYHEMHAGACFSPADCWFGGAALPAPEIGAFQLHWNGKEMVEQPYPGEGHAIEEMRIFEGQLFESVELAHGDRVENPLPEPPVIRRINPEGISPVFEPIPTAEIPLYWEKVVNHRTEEEYPEALGLLHLAVGEGDLWAAAGPQVDKSSPLPGEVTVVRLSGGKWTQVLGPNTSPTSVQALPEEAEAVNSIAVEPGSGDAWLALDYNHDAAAPSPIAHSLLVRVSTEGRLSEEELPSESEGSGPKGASDKITCPAANDCWMATTQGWLYHRATESERSLPEDTDPAFAGLITYRPADKGVPQVSAAEPPEDTSGLVAETELYGHEITEIQKPPEAREYVALLSHVKTRLLGRRVLEMRFHLAVAARLRLLAKRKRKVVAATPLRTLRAGNRRLTLALDPTEWPTKIELQTHALAKLPTVPARHHSANEETISTGFAVLPHTPAWAGSGLLSPAGLLP